MNKLVSNVLLGVALTFVVACGQDTTTEQTKVKASEAAPVDVQAHPNLLLAAKDLPTLKTEAANYPLFSRALNAAKTTVDEAMAAPVDVPFPKDPGGGYTHEQHKKNALLMYQAATLSAITGDTAYSDWAIALMKRYAELYPSVPLHPEHKHQAPGKLFWQVLNDAWWLVYIIQAYDALLPQMSQADQTLISQQLLLPHANFLSEGSAETFNKVHNHGTWAAAAVGMTGLVLKDDHLVNIALRGLDGSGASGFLAQLDQLFSPDGYYTEGPYYQRYALLPFVVFARALERNKPELGIFEYRDGIVLKAIYASIQLSNGGLFFPLNDAIKDKGLDTIEMVFGVDVAYGLTGDKDLLAIAQYQQQVTLNGDGLAVARDLHQLAATPAFSFGSKLFRDGPAGDQGGVAILRSNNATVVFKAASQGMGHGHFDRLGWIYYDGANEIVSDYGAARYLNVEPKRGGIYLPENDTWAKQTVAHNALVRNEESQFSGDVKAASKHNPEITRFTRGDGWQLVSATESHAYPGTEFDRTFVLLDNLGTEAPVVLDLLRVDANEAANFDLPFHYQGQLMFHTGKANLALDALKPLGKANGYQHLWNKGELVAEKNTVQVSWLQRNRFYTLTQWMPEKSRMALTELGANDPEFNLRREAGLVVRYAKTKQATFVSALESHGEYNGVREYTLAPRGDIGDIGYSSVGDYSLVHIKLKSGLAYTVAIAHVAQDGEHTVNTAEGAITWTGDVTVVPNN
ncbi:alginate lyase family protein [Simiduia curdlanivorans]|uniref:Alginate lyase family protein n=1 Tax=Simiduia curdlanivorans TaxID=1492769 RepID=A0ABV8V5M0_9GAMM|nr:alginate lyase family protein [Simiduia curdlanivorans]MDN3638265.1 alginate lyase family protein [Simiduia curdlanivorans]